MKLVNIVVEQHGDNIFIAYPVGVDAVIVGQGETEETAADDAVNALEYHQNVFGHDGMKYLPIEVTLTEVETT
ncbi:hypothetical protein MNBD_NITROSPINAE04-1874 [hydrothermal vent metagenome]|uniref:HicB-like antitoxin of toxin-antitoxin system domain-containing protein n=1 Tax=hydrothermal vent metagenome TaxID=652676 RepID=A0A3B1CBV4_9ZZZZ